MNIFISKLKTVYLYNKQISIYLDPVLGLELL